MAGNQFLLELSVWKEKVVCRQLQKDFRKDKEKKELHEILQTSLTRREKKLYGAF